MKPLILGTTSPYKISLFERLDLPFETAAPDFDEVVDPDHTPPLSAAALSAGKAQAIAKRYAEHVIVAGDQILALGNQILHKPGSVDAAVRQIQQLAGRVHALHTAFTLLDSATGRTRTQVVTSYLSVHANLNADFLRDMVEKDQSMDCVGGYKIESRGHLIMRKVESDDNTAIVGLPLISLSEALHAWGYLQHRFDGDPRH